nr:PEP-CTERM sorting domain-containing protein [Desulfobacula sp.]
MKKINLLWVLLAILFVPSFALSSTIDRISGFAVKANDMDGMAVTITFSDGSTAQQLWDDIGGDSSGVSGVQGDEWSLINERYYPGYDDTMMNWWTLSGTDISSITINAVSAGIVFDIITSSFGTFDSRQGWWDANDKSGTASSGGGYLAYNANGGYYYIDNSATNGIAFSWSFSDEIEVTGQTQPNPLDVWGALTLTFASGFTGDLIFSLDTDTSAVPEPATMVLFGLGLLGISVAGRKRS